ncbi:MAG TPA: transposase [Herpetosiphonaceae bacterium]
MIRRSFKYRYYPTQTQAERLSAWQRACHEVQRLCILQRRIAWKKRTTLYSGQKPMKPQPSYYSQGPEVTQLRQVYPDLADVPADTMNAMVARVDTAYQRMFKERKAGRRATVRWADKPEHIGLHFRGQDRGTGITPTGGRHAFVRLAKAGKLGTLRIRYHRPIPEGAEIKQAHITRAADGWYISFSCLIPAPAPLPAAHKDVNGVDLGCIHEGDRQRIAVVDDGRIYRSTSGLKRNAKRLATLQKLVSKRRVRGTAKHADPNSKRTTRRRQKIARLHQRIARQREHTLQYTARRLVDTADVTVFEDISWKPLRRRGKGRRKRGLNRAMSTASPGRLVALTQEKADAANRSIQKVPARGTSQQCSVCGDDKTHKPLKVRRWVCQVCRTEHDRDVNAAKNVKQRFKSDSGPCRSGVRGEEAAGETSEQPSTNREGAAAPRREQRATSRIDHDSDLHPARYEDFRQALFDFGDWDAP